MSSYLIKSILCSAVFLLAFKGLFEREKMQVFNRFYLLSGLILALIIPFLTFNNYTPASKAVTKVLSNTAIFAGVTSSSNTVKQVPNYNFSLLLTIYFTVTAILFARFVINLSRISKTIRQNPVTQYKNAKIVLIEQEFTPYSFLKYIFVNKEIYTKGLVENEILTHELLHVTQKHSLDILFVEVIQALFWFNPCLPFYKKAIQLNHEFLADEAVAENCDNIKVYQHLLITKANQQPLSSLTSPLNYLVTKKRLIMMTKTTSFMKSVCVQMAVIPLIAASVFLFSMNAYAQHNASSAQSSVQQGGNGLDTSLKRMLERYIGAPRSVSKGENGMALIRVYKSQGSVMLKTVYASNKDYDLNVDQRLIEVANRKNAPVVLKEDVVVPVFFYAQDETHKETPANLTPAAKKVINEMGAGTQVSEPIWIITFIE